MARNVNPPFSARNRGAHKQIDDAFPVSGRNGLLHILHDLVERNYVAGWISLARELQRIGRIQPDQLRESSVEDIARAHGIVVSVLRDLPWEKVYDFCERLHSHLPTEISGYNSYREEVEVVVTTGEIQDYIAGEFHRLFFEEALAFEFCDGTVKRRGLRHTTAQISRANVVLGDERLASARKHFNKALYYFQNASKPDPENSVKESVCAVEAAARVLFENGATKTLGDVVKSITGPEAGELPKAIAQTFHGLYGFRSGGEGVGHGGANGGQVTSDIAEYVLAVAASQIILLVGLANLRDGDVPF